MNILVCVKHVPDTEGRLVPDGDGTWISPEDQVFRINRFDEYAVEEALRIKEELPGTTVETVTVGPPRAEGAVRRAMEMGADRGYHIVLSAETYLSPAATSSALAAFAGGRNYDLVLCGMMSEDLMQCAVGPMTAEKLGFPGLSGVIARRFLREGELEVEREVEGGGREQYRLHLPALLTLQSGINRPRYPSLSNVMRAKKQEVPRIPLDTFLSVITESTRMLLPERARNTSYLNGTAREKAAALIHFLKERSFL